MKPGSELVLNSELILSGYVVADADAAWMGETGFFCPQQVREGLAAINGHATIRLSSDGGDPYAGEAIRAVIAGHPGGATIIVEGIAASAASLVFMGAADRKMSSASFLMIHDPSSLVWANPEEHRAEANRLDKIGDAYAAAYAAATGKPAEECRAIMRAETWFSTEEAIAAGFATAVSDVAEPPVAAAAMSLAQARGGFSAMKLGMAAMVARKKQPAAGGSTASMAIREEAEMPEEAQAAQTANPTQVATTMAAPTTPNTDAIRAAAAAEARAQFQEITRMASPFLPTGQLTQADVDAVINEGLTPEAAGRRFLSMVAGSRPAETAAPSRPLARVTRDETDTQMQGMVDALCGETSGPAEAFRGIRLRSLAMHLAGPQRSSFNEVDAVRAGMASVRMTGGAVGVSDFTYITGNAMNRVLRQEYERRAATWQAVSGAPIQAADFRQIVITRFGGDLQLKKVLANGEYNSATLTDNGDTVQVERRGRMINLTFEAVINDDMNALTRIPAEFAMQARIMENSMVWNLIRTNAALASDNLALFHATHKNLIGTGVVISAAAVAAMRKLMWEQQALGVKDADDFLNLTPDLLIVPPNLEIAALQFATQTTPASDGTTNPYKSTLTPIVVPNLGASAGGSDISWYLVSSAMPPISVARLDGYDAPTITAVDNMNPDIKTYVARHIFGAAATEFRGAVKNPGA